VYGWISRHVSFRGYLRVQKYQIEKFTAEKLYPHIYTSIYTCLQMMWEEEGATGSNKAGNKEIREHVILLLCSLKLRLQSCVCTLQKLVKYHYESQRLMCETA
jgi:hypothetical protein